MTRHRVFAVVAAMASTCGLAVFALAAPAGACGGLVAPNGTVHLLRTTTLAAYHDGIEHYITSFQFVGGGGGFGSIVPLPAVPTKVERAGSWTLQRLERETSPVLEEQDGLVRASAALAPAQELLNTRIDALDITVLKGGGTAVGDWARQHGFALTPDAPEMLDYYASRSPIFLAARFDGSAAAAKGQRIGDGTPIDVTMALDNPWVPLRILTLGRGALEPISADVYLLTDRAPSLLPAPSATNDMSVFASRAASELLLGDLRRDKNMGWIPTGAWLSEIKIDGPGIRLHHDLAIDTSGAGHPSLLRAGLISATGDTAGQTLSLGPPSHRRTVLVWSALASVMVAGALLALAVRRWRRA